MKDQQINRDNIIFSSSDFKSINDRDFEIVERKGVGHPDTLVDGLAEVISNEYAKYCKENFGVVLHHNLDKTAIIGGLVDIDFGRGEMLEKAKVIMNGRMSDCFGDKKINIVEFQRKVVELYLKKLLPNIDVKEWFEIVNFTNSYSHNQYWYHPRGEEDVPDHVNPHANDTSACVGYWPLSVVENLVLKLESYFYNEDDSPRYEYIGQDIKFMAVRKGKSIDITSCIPFISTKTVNQRFYDIELRRIVDELNELAMNNVPDGYSVVIHANTADTPGDHYLLLTGSCIEAGEEGVVGRGNKSRGTISTVRPYSMEAANGKNPVYHVGKVFTVVADSISRMIAEEFNCECNVFITTKNKDNLYSPNRLIVETNRDIDVSRGMEIVVKNLSYKYWTDEIVNRGLLVPKPGRGNSFVLD